MRKASYEESIMFVFKETFKIADFSCLQSYRKYQKFADFFIIFDIAQLISKSKQTKDQG